MRRFGWFLIFAVLGAALVFAQGTKKEDALMMLANLKPWEVPYIAPPVKDTLGVVDTLFMEMLKGKGEGEWVLQFHVFNDESLFALSFPIRHDSLLTFDSISLEGTRADFFQLKMVNKVNDTAKKVNAVTVGLFSALMPNAPTIEPGRGTVMRMYFQAPAGRPVSIRSVAPIYNMPPGLEFVNPKGVPIHPAVVRIGDSPSPAPEKKPAKPGGSSTKKKKG